MRLLGRDTPTLSDVFDYVEAGQMEKLLHRLLTPTQSRYAASESVALEIGARTLASALPAWITVELAEAGLVRWKHSWSQVAVRDLEDAPEASTRRSLHSSTPSHLRLLPQPRRCAKS